MDYKLGSYSLNAVSQEFLNEQKEDVHYSIISKLQEGMAYFFISNIQNHQIQEGV